MHRRRFLTLMGGGVAGLAAAGVCYGQGQDTWDLRLTCWRVPVPRLPHSLDGVRVAHLSDFHVGDDVPASFVVQALEMAQAAKPDLIALTGDFVSYNWKNLEHVQPALSRLQAPLGVYACLGNHDDFCDRAKYITRGLEDCGIEVLTNASRRLPGHKDAWMVGIDDPCTERHDFDRALKGVPHKDFRLLLAHSPEIADAAAELSVDLVLAGHTHGGQVNLPLVGPPVVPTKYGPRYAWGLFDCHGTRLVVSRGVGVVEPVIRFRCPPEVGLLTLCRSDWALPAGQWGVDGRALGRKLRGSLTSLRSLLSGNPSGT